MANEHPSTKITTRRRRMTTMMRRITWRRRMMYLSTRPLGSLKSY
jgi:hypothetical protein